MVPCGGMAHRRSARVWPRTKRVADGCPDLPKILFGPFRDTRERERKILGAPWATVQHRGSELPSHATRCANRGNISTLSCLLYLEYCGAQVIAGRERAGKQQRDGGPTIRGLKHQQALSHPTNKQQFRYPPGSKISLALDD